MGVCCSTNNKKQRYSYNNKDRASSVAIQKADVDSSITRERKSYIKKNPAYEAIISSNYSKLDELLDSGEFSINSYTLENNCTALIVAVQRSTAKTVEYLLDKGAKVDLIELETGNTPLMLAALDFKLEIIRTLLKYKPNINHINLNKQDIFKLLTDTFNQETKNSSPDSRTHYVKKSALNNEEQYKLKTITDMLSEYKIRNQNVDLLDKDDDYNIKENRMNSSFASNDRRRL